MSKTAPMMRENTILWFQKFTSRNFSEINLNVLQAIRPKTIQKFWNVMAREMIECVGISNFLPQY